MMPSYEDGTFGVYMLNFHLSFHRLKIFLNANLRYRLIWHTHTIKHNFNLSNQTLNIIIYKKHLSTSQIFLGELGFKLLYGVILPSLLGQTDVPSFTMSNFQLDDNHCKPNVLNHTEFKQKFSNCISRPFKKY